MPRLQQRLEVRQDGGPAVRGALALALPEVGVRDGQPHDVVVGLDVERDGRRLPGEREPTRAVALQHLAAAVGDARAVGADVVDRLEAIRTVREFDEVYTAPHFGFLNATDYYHRASAMRVVDRIRVPALIITAEDDPFVPVEPFRHPSVARNPHIQVVITRHGGHCAFVAGDGAGHDGYWAETRIVDFARTVSAPAAPR